MRVDYGELALLSQVLTRQEQHARAIEGYVRQNCSLSPQQLGLLLMALYPATEGAMLLGSNAVGLIGGLSRWGADTAEANLNAYVEADSVAHAEFAAIMDQLGISVGPYSDPRQHQPSLGAAQESAPSSYGEPDVWIWEKAASAGTGAGELVRDTFTTAVDRVHGWSQPAGGVAELTNPTSYLVAPVVGENFVEDLRWTAGPILGGVDWLAEQLLGFSVLQECVLKPFGGDWQAINKSAEAWKHSGRAVMELGNNLSGLPGQTSSWTGAAADQFSAAMSLLSGAVVGLSFACNFASGLMEKVGLVAKLACTGIARVLRWISEELLIIAAQAAVPVVGWVVGAVDVIRKVWRIVGLVRVVYSLIDAVMDAIIDFIESRERIVDAVFALENLVEYAGRRALAAP